MIRARDIHIQNILFDVEDFEPSAFIHDHLDDSNADAIIRDWFFGAFEDEEFIDIKITHIGDKVLVTCVTKFNGTGR